jgi:hypothetical protein
MPPTPFNIPAQYMTANQTLGFQWPTLAELKDEPFLYPWSHNKEFNEYLSKETNPHSQGLYTGPPPAAPTYTTPKILPANVLAQHIIASEDKLFFISHLVRSREVRE